MQIQTYIQNVMKDTATDAHVLLTTFHNGVHLCAWNDKFSKKEKVSMMVVTRDTGTTKTIDVHDF